VLILEDHPLIGRPAEEGRRELVMGRRTEAFVALYRWLPADDTALILAIRHSREAGCFDV
jgi:plasmid stabilization system protein ParE